MARNVETDCMGYVPPSRGGHCPERSVYRLKVKCSSHAYYRACCPRHLGAAIKVLVGTGNPVETSTMPVIR